MKAKDLVRNPVGSFLGRLAGIVAHLAREYEMKELRSKFPHASFYGLCKVNDLTEFSIGKGSNLKSATIDSLGKVTIGEYVHTGDNLMIFSTDHDYRSEKAIPYDSERIPKPVIIEDFVWIGANVSILPGVTIGEGAIVGMGSVVTEAVARCCVVAGNPASPIGKRDEGLFNRLKGEGRYF